MTPAANSIAAPPRIETPTQVNTPTPNSPWRVRRAGRWTWAGYY